MSKSLLVSGKLHFRNSLQKAGRWFEQPFSVPIALFVVAFASYGLLINRLGYYWDDYPLTYIHNVFGPAGLGRYFSTNRPFWGLLYQITFSMFNQPWLWQITAFLLRWLSAVLVWLLFREIWPKPKQLAIWVSMMFLVYPGFIQQHISVIYSNLFIVMDCFMLSLFLNVKVLRQTRHSKPSWKSWFWHFIALLLSLYNLLAMEYFFTLELLRPLLIWHALNRENEYRSKRFKLMLLNWSPYFALWGGVTVWRVFFFSFQTHNYPMLLFQSIENSAIQAMISLIRGIVTSLWVVIVSAWAHIFLPPNPTQLGMRTTIVTVILIMTTAGLTIWYLWRNLGSDMDRAWFKSVIMVGLVACLLGGVPWWLTELQPILNFPSDRFTLPFILGVSLIIGGLLGVLPLRAWVKTVILGVLIGFAVGNQFQAANGFRRDWETQRRFFWQLAWRVPGLDQGTTLMVNDLPVTFYSDNSLTAPLNWFWAPENTSQDMWYLLLYPSQRLGHSLTSLAPDIAISVDYLAAQFNGSTSKVVSMEYDPPACLRVLDRTLDSDNRMLTMDMQAAAALSSTEWINPNGLTAGDILPGNLYDPEPSHGWCYYYEIADLARQQEKWEDVAYLGDIAYQLNDYPNDPSEHFLFIEGYAHTGNWERAHALSEQSQSVTPLMEPLLCRLWQRIAGSTADNQEKDATITLVYSQLNCSP
ncbi:MAG: hypothetical protein A2Y53_03065 [Chloroflexi bacterium RBG_16_47_49]|nr:MAG: hypothetical protein A2Y53_03065 [Chloroflexi bacterium RBG_16_47_49]